MKFFRPELGSSGDEAKRRLPSKRAVAAASGVLTVALALSGCGGHPDKGSAAGAPKGTSQSQSPTNMPTNQPEASPTPSPSEVYTKATLQCTGYQVLGTVMPTNEIDYSFMPQYTAEPQDDGLPANPDPNSILVSIQTDPNDPKSAQAWPGNSMPGILKIPLDHQQHIARVTLYNFSDQLNTPDSYDLINHIQDGDSFAASHVVECLPGDGLIDISNNVVRNSYGQVMFPQELPQPN
jgi:hypothetical protein